MPGETRAPTLSVVLVSYNTRELTLRCLRALHEALGGLSAEVWLVDNASTDGSVAAVGEAFPKVHVLAQDRNLGFGAANNLAMAQASGRYILLLNTDAFVTPGALQTLVAYLETHPSVGVVGPRLLNEDGSLQRSCFRFPSPRQAWAENLWLSALFPNHRWLGDYRRWEHDEVREVDWVVGACMLVRREGYLATRGFDETFFMYAEEADWQWRIRSCGWSVAFEPAAVVTHLGGASGAAERAAVRAHFFNSLDYYQIKNHGRRGLVLLRMAMITGCFMRAVLWAGAWLVPRRREIAAAKLKLHAWLLKRQSTNWRPALRRAGR